jgi:hypothetical protein
MKTDTRPEDWCLNFKTLNILPLTRTATTRPISTGSFHLLLTLPTGTAMSTNIVVGSVMGTSRGNSSDGCKCQVCVDCTSCDSCLIKFNATLAAKDVAKRKFRPVILMMRQELLLQHQLFQLRKDRLDSRRRQKKQQAEMIGG